MKTILISLIICACASGADNMATYKQYGFSIRLPVDKEVSYGLIVNAFLPPKNGFSSNVNVMLQDFSGKLEDYDALTQGQFKQAKLNVIVSKNTGTFIEYEYSGNQNGVDLHWYSRAYKGPKGVFLITGTTLESEWKSQKDLVIKSVTSFSLLK